MAEYMAFIWDDETAWENADPRTVETTMAAHEDFIARHVGALHGGNRLDTSDAATSIRCNLKPAPVVSDYFAPLPVNRFPDLVAVAGEFAKTDLDECFELLIEIFTDELTTGAGQS